MEKTLDKSILDQLFLMVAHWSARGFHSDEFSLTFNGLCELLKEKDSKRFFKSFMSFKK